MSFQLKFYKEVWIRCSIYFLLIKEIIQSHDKTLRSLGHRLLLDDIHIIAHYTFCPYLRDGKRVSLSWQIWPTDTNYLEQCIEEGSETEPGSWRINGPYVLPINIKSEPMMHSGPQIQLWTENHFIKHAIWPRRHHINISTGRLGPPRLSVLNIWIFWYMASLSYTIATIHLCLLKFKLVEVK